MANKKRKMAMPDHTGVDSSEFDAEAKAAWDAEIEARLAQVDRGEVVLIDCRESIDRARHSLKRPS
jgi:hypothetical protein